VNSIRFLLRRGTAVTAVVALFVLLAACSSPSEPGGDATDDPAAGGGTVAVTDGSVDLSAASLEFDANVIEATAGEAFTINLTNDDSAPHNVSVYTEEGGEEIVRGDVIEGGATTEVQVEALDAGEYFFVCDIHPEMNGTVVVTEG
jgi:plastocyanin